MTTNIQHHAHRAERKARSAMNKAPDDGLEMLSRVGFAAKGAVYLVLGVLAVLAAVGEGGQVGGTKDALRTIANQPFGTILLGALAVGLVGYAIYRFAAAATGAPYEGEDHAGVKRVAAAASGLAYSGLSIAAFQLLIDGGTSGSRQTWLAEMVTWPGGPILIGAIGVFVIGAGLYQLYKAYSTDFTKRLRTQQMSRTERTWLTRLGRFGLAARGVVLPMIGFGLVQVAMTNSPSQYQGLGASLSELAQQSYGWIILGVVAAGLAAYGVYMIACAKYRKLADETPA